jgi:hypothetical protein
MLSPLSSALSSGLRLCPFLFVAPFNLSAILSDEKAAHANHGAASSVLVGTASPP